MSAKVLLSTEHLYATHPGRPMVLTDVNVSFRAGVRVAILGANGSGKTTLMRCLSGSLKPAKGHVKRGDIVVSYGRAQLREHRRAVQLVLQDPDDQLFSADVSQDVSFGPMNMGLKVDEVRDRVSESLELLGASHLAERATYQLSYGERKRVAVAGAVAMRPDLLLLDEPTAGLDPVGVTQMLEALDRLRDHGTTVAMATHDVDLALVGFQRVEDVELVRARARQLHLSAHENAGRDLVGSRGPDGHRLPLGTAPSHGLAHLGRDEAAHLLVLDLVDA